MDIVTNYGFKRARNSIKDYYKSKKRRFSTTERVVGTVAAAELGFIAGNVPGAVLAGATAYDIMDNDYPQKKKNMTTGVYAGKFNKKYKPKPSFETQSLKYGFHVSNEVYGRVEDATTTYVGHSTCELQLIAQTITGALTRKLFAKAGIPVDVNTEEIPLSSATPNSSGFRIIYQTQDIVTGAIANLNYDTVDNLYTTLTAHTAMTSQIFNYLSNAVVAEPFRLMLYENNTVFRLLSMINIGSEHITMQCGSEIKIQNRTKSDGAAAGDTSTDRVDAQPLIARQYLFRNGDIRVRNPVTTTINGSDNSIYLNGCALTGPTLLRSVDMGTVTFQNRLPPKFFSNCVATADTILQPGQIKKSYINYRISGLLQNTLKRMRAQSASATVVQNVVGRCELFIFEEKIRTSGVNNISCQYERRYKCGVILKSTGPGTLNSLFTVSSEKNLI